MSEAEHILSALGSHRVDAYSDWVAVGMALHGDGHPCDLWDRWSAQSSKYKPGACAAKWKSFKPGGNGKAVGLGTLVTWAKQDSPNFKPMAVPGFKPRLVSRDEPPKPVVREATESPSTALAEQANKIFRGEIKAVPFGPWRTLSRYTQALLPGTITMLCGGQGVGKSLFAMEACLTWLENGVEFKYLGLEEDRLFYLNRALAQLENNSLLCLHDWKAENKKLWVDAWKRQDETLDELGKRIVESEEPMTAGQIVDWIRLEVPRNRVLIVDPITAKNSSENIWKDDEKLINDLRGIVKGSQTSVILITHPKKMGAGAKKESAKGWGDDMAGGAAYERFSATVIHLTGNKDIETINVQKQMGATQEEINRRVKLAKTRNGNGQWLTIGMYFDPKTLRHIEKGVICS